MGVVAVTGGLQDGVEVTDILLLQKVWSEVCAAAKPPLRRDEDRFNKYHVSVS